MIDPATSVGDLAIGDAEERNSDVVGEDFAVVELTGVTEREDMPHAAYLPC
jgi:hypothetical protein